MKRHILFSMWAVLGSWLVLTVCLSGESAWNPSVLMAMALILVFTSIVDHPLARRVLRPGSLLIAVIICYVAAADRPMRFSMDGVGSLLVQPAEFVLIVGVVVNAVGRWRPPKRPFAAASVHALLLVGAFLIVLSIVNSVVLRRFYPIEMLGLLYGLSLKMIESTLLLFLAVRLVACLGCGKTTLRIVGGLTFLAAVVSWLGGGSS